MCRKHDAVPQIINNFPSSFIFSQQTVAIAMFSSFKNMASKTFFFL
jgi:hypothetical protein